MPIWGPGAVLEGERGGRVSSQSRCGVGGWASLGVRALAKAGRGWSGRGSSGGQSSVIHAFCFGALSKSTRREVNWQKRRNEGTSCSQRSGCIGRQWLRDCRSTWMASANCLACFAEYFINPFRKGHMPSVRNRTKDSSEFSRASQDNLAAWLYPKGISSDG